MREILNANKEKNKTIKKPVGCFSFTMLSFEELRPGYVLNECKTDRALDYLIELSEPDISVSPYVIERVCN